MSTPSEKPFDPFDLSPYAPKRARENADRTPVENADNDSHEDAEAVALAYVPRAAMWPAEEHAIDRDGGTRAPLAADTCGEKVADDSAPADADLARLESSLRWLQREGAVGRLPRAVQLSPVPGLPPLDPQASRPRAEQFINGVRVPPSLASERLRPPPPPRARRDNLRGPLRVLLASVIAAPIAYYLSVGNSAPAPGGESSIAAFASRLVAGSEFPLPKGRLGEAADFDTAVSSRNKLAAQPTASSDSTLLSAGVEAPALLLSIPAAAQAAPAGKTVRELDPESIKLLMQQGGQFVASGDLVAARLVYQRAAESGNAAAALALGATFDPAVLAKIGVRGMGADIEKARSWYEKAKEFGSSEAPRRLEFLANR
jgi:hypothetical protein